MVFEEWFESLVHRHHVHQSTVEEEGQMILKRLHETLDLNAEAPRNPPSTENPGSKTDE